MTIQAPEAYQLRYIETVQSPGTIYSTWSQWSVNNRDENGRVDRSVDVDTLFLARVREIAALPTAQVVKEYSTGLCIHELVDNSDRVIREYRVRW